MKVYGQLEKAQLQNTATDLSLAATGLIFWNSTDGVAKIFDGVNLRELLLNNEKLILGHGTAGNNVRLHRSASGKLQLVTDADVSVDGAAGTTLAEFSAKVETYTDTGKPTFGNPGRLIYNSTLKTIQLDDGTQWTSVGAGGSTVGIPTDGIFGTSGPIAGVTAVDTVADAFDKVETILALLAPAPPAALSTKTLTLSGAYTAKAAVTGTVTTNVTDVTTPTVSVANFNDGNRGTLSAKIDAATDGTILLSAASDVGNNGALNITADSDPYVGQAGKAGFWMQLSANITPTTAKSLGAHTFQMLHTTTGNTPVLTVTIDNPGTVSITGQGLTTSGSSSYVSGVPGLALGQTATAVWNVVGGVGNFYNATQVGSVSGAGLSSHSLNPGSPPAVSATVPFSQAMTVQSSGYTETLAATMVGYNSKGGSASATVTTAIRIDTVSNESARSKSGQGQYPAAGSGASQYGSSWDATVSLATAGNEELQMINGTYQYPSGNYTAKTPAGPDYSSVPLGTYSNYRWVTMNLGAVSAASNTTITFNGASNFGGSTITAGLIVEVRVDGATPTSGWLDGNANYPGVGNPTNNGDPAMVNASSSATVKLVTFGASPKTGNVWVRVGIPSGSTKTFTGITRS